MRFLLFALKNILRNRRRSAMIVAMTALGSIAMLLAGGYAAANFRGLRESTIGNGLGHLQIGAVGFREDEDRPLARGLTDVAQARAIIARDPAVRAVTPRIDFMGLLSNGEKSVPFLGRAVDPESEYGSAGFPTLVTKGRGVAPSDRDEAILGVGLARALNVEVGAVLTVLTSTSEGALNGLDVVVVGLSQSAVREIDDRSVVVRLDTAQHLLMTDRVSKLVVRLHRTEDTEAVQARLARALAGGARPVEIVTWSDLATFYHQVRALYSGIFLFLGFIIVSLVVISSANAIAMAVVERTREIGTLMAVGTGRVRIVVMCLAEAAGLGLLGGATGIGTGLLLARVLTSARIMMPPPPTYTTGFPLVIDIVPPLAAEIFVTMVITLLVAAALPAVRASRLRITEALAHV